MKEAIKLRKTKRADQDSGLSVYCKIKLPKVANKNSRVLQ